MKKLSDFFENIKVETAKDIVIKGLSFDSRKVKKGDLFFAISGENFKGSEFLEQAFQNGAVAAVASSDESISTDLPVLKVSDVRRELARVSHLFFDQPSSKLKCIGITGTNGKTSIAWLVSNLVSCVGLKSAMIGTLGMKHLSKNEPIFEIAINNTTPSSLEIQSFLAASVPSRVEVCAIEATSQGIAQKRTDDINWDVAIFTNLTRDHLDLHGSFEAYGELKAKLFKEQLVNSKAKKKSAVINIDDPWGYGLSADLKNLNLDVYSVSSNDSSADVYCSQFENTAKGLVIEASFFGKAVKLESQLIGCLLYTSPSPRD